MTKRPLAARIAAAALLAALVGTDLGRPAVALARMTDAETVPATFTAEVLDPPTALDATATLGLIVTLTWTPTIDARATGYRVLRGTSNGGPYTQIATTGPTDSNYTDLTVTNGTTYFYVVTASNAAGESGSSNQATATPTAPLTIPAAPTNLVATVVSRTQINLTWTDNAANESGYLIERSTNGSTFTQLIPTAPAGATTFASTGLSANKKYYYRVRATNAAGQSVYSNTASAKTPK